MGDFLKALREKKTESVADHYYPFPNKNVLVQGDLINELDIFLESYFLAFRNIVLVLKENQITDYNFWPFLIYWLKEGLIKVGFQSNLQNDFDSDSAILLSRSSLCIPFGDCASNQ